jgi:hypothetical protein
MAKYGIETFRDGKPLRFTISQDDVYGKLFFSKVETQEVFNYIDENGEVHTREENEKHNRLARTQNFIPWVSHNTHEIEGKSLIAYSEKLEDFMDIKVPIDFDESQLAFEDELTLINPTYIVNSHGRRLDKKFVFHVSAENAIKTGVKPKTDKK